MKKIIMILVGVLFFIGGPLFVVYYNQKEGFDLNIRIGFEKPHPPPKRPGVPDEYNYPEGVKNSDPEYKPMLSAVNTQMLRAHNDDDYGASADVGIERGS
jgi:hypothetical protein